MCGIAGQWNLDGSAIAPFTFDGFVDALAHRGPDGRGTYIDQKNGMALGHRLLAIQGAPGEGLQPRALADRYWITFNGEIFNFVALRTELAALGHLFRTDTDTEVVLAAYAQWGEDCLSRFNGMWALAIWDAQQKKMFLSVDRFSVKSCVYLHTGRYFAFASELKAFSYLDRYRVEADKDEVSLALATGGAGNAVTWMKGVCRIPAGHSLTVTAGKVPVLKRWWNTLDHLVEPPRSNAARIEMFAELFTSAVQLRLSGNAKIAIPLSGGMDSSAIVGIANASDSAPKHACFFIKKHGKLDEEQFAMSMARHVGVHPVIVPSAATLDVDTMQDVIYSYENFGVSSDGPTQLYRAIKQSGASVSLCGHGGDELIGGYSIYIENALRDALHGVPNPARVLDLARINRNLSVNSEEFSLFQGWDNTKRRVHDAIRARLGRPALAHAGVPPRHTRPDDFVQDEFPSWFDELNRELYRDVHHGFMQRILRSFDYASMASGVESRTPFLDWRLVVYLFSLPSNVKIGKGYTKRILRDAMRGLMPDDVLWRRSKIGFIESPKYFFNPEIVAWMGDIFTSRSFHECGMWDGKQIASAFERWKKQGMGSFGLGKKLLSVAQAHFLVERMQGNSAAAQQLARRSA